MRQKQAVLKSAMDREASLAEAAEANHDVRKAKQHIERVNDLKAKLLALSSDENLKHEWQNFFK